MQSTQTFLYAAAVANYESPLHRSPIRYQYYSTCGMLVPPVISSRLRSELCKLRRGPNLCIFGRVRSCFAALFRSHAPPRYFLFCSIFSFFQHVFFASIIFNHLLTCQPNLQLSSNATTSNFIYTNPLSTALLTSTTITTHTNHQTTAHLCCQNPRTRNRLRSKTHCRLG